MRIIATLLLWFIAAAAHAQLGSTVLRGVVSDAENGEPLYAVTIVNTTNQVSTYTDNAGFFTITASPGDKIAITFIGYKSTLMDAPAIAGRALQQVKLQRQQYKLGEVIVRPNYTPYQADSVARRSTYQRTLARQKGGSVMSPVTLLAEKFSKNSKRIFKFQRDFAMMEGQRFIDSRYTPELVAELTHLEGDTLVAFMNLYPMPYDYSRAATELELKMWIRTNFKDWQAKGRPMVVITADSTFNRPAAR